jgi:hypothetical protein
MRCQVFKSEAVLELFREQPVATMEELKAALGTSVDMTVFRKLREIGYFSSYSHRGKFYTTAGVARFDKRGLWSCRGVRFSARGSLIDTAEDFVVNSSTGYFASELSSELGVEVKDPLVSLVRQRRLAREKVAARYLYCCADPVRRRQQVLARQMPVDEEPFGKLAASGIVASEEIKAAIILFLSTLDEKQRRLYAGLEALRLGRGGDQRIAEITGLDVHTVGKGRQELIDRDVDLERTRRIGGGRKPVEKKLRK